MKNTKKVVIIGAGFGGLNAAHALSNSKFRSEIVLDGEVKITIAV